MPRRHLLPLGLVLALGCTPDRGDVRQWSATDHGTPERPVAQEGNAGAGKDTMAALVETTWRKTCAPCHGISGRGDGPQGPMTNAADLTRAEWLAKTSDADLAKTIREGKGRMPANPDLQEPIVLGLIKKIRGGGAPSSGHGP